MDRSSGILLPVSALPGPCGIGDLGADARDFIDFLAAAGQRYWQILPLNPPDGAHSPYLSASTFAGSTDLLSPEPFLARGALTAGEVIGIVSVEADGTPKLAVSPDSRRSRAKRHPPRPRCAPRSRLSRGCATTACTWP